MNVKTNTHEPMLFRNLSAARSLKVSSSPDGTPGVAVPHRQEPPSTPPDARRLNSAGRHRCLPSSFVQLALLVVGLGTTGFVVPFVTHSLFELFRGLTEGTSEFRKL